MNMGGAFEFVSPNAIVLHFRKCGLWVHIQHAVFTKAIIVVLRSATFIERVCAKAAERGFQCTYRLVEYYDEETHDGETGPFLKPSRFAYQNEFRFAISPGDIKPICLEVGSLLDITSEILPLARINELIKFEVKYS
jgi:hypothetical protein